MGFLSNFMFATATTAVTPIAVGAATLAITHSPMAAFGTAALGLIGGMNMSDALCQFSSDSGVGAGELTGIGILITGTVLSLS